MWKSGRCSATPHRKRFSLQALLPSILPLLIAKEDGGGFWGSFPPGANAGEAMHLLWLGHKTLLDLFPHRLDGSRVLIWEARVIEMITLEVLGRGVTQTHTHTHTLLRGEAERCTGGTTTTGKAGALKRPHRDASNTGPSQAWRLTRSSESTPLLPTPGPLSISYKQQWDAARRAGRETLIKLKHSMGPRAKTNSKTHELKPFGKPASP